MGVDVKIKELLPGVRTGFIMYGSGSRLSRKKSDPLLRLGLHFTEKTFQIVFIKKAFGDLS
jgi:hypothetical protein